MKVKELIEKLKTFPEDREVYLMFSEDNPFDAGDTVTDIFMIEGSKVTGNNAVYITRM